MPTEIFWVLAGNGLLGFSLFAGAALLILAIEKSS